METDGFTFCITPDLLQQVGGVDIDLSYMGFTVEPRIPLNAAGSSCGSCGSGGCSTDSSSGCSGGSCSI